MEFDEKVVHFNIFEVMKYPSDSHSVFVMSVIDLVVQEIFEIDSRNKLEVVLTKHLKLGATYDVELGAELECMVETLQSLASTKTRYELATIFTPESHQKLLTSVVQAPKVELKSLPKHLKYAYLEGKKTLSIIISAKLDPSQEERLIRILKDHKKAIRWTIADIKGIDLSFCMHRIWLEDDVKHVRQA